MTKLNMLYKLIHIKTIRFILSSMVLTFVCFSASAQEEPPRPLQVTTYQNLSFGAIIQGNTGGTIIIDPQGSRSVTGDIIPVNMGYTYYPAIFEIRAIPGAIITIANSPDVAINGSNGGSVLLHVGTSIPNSPFINTKNPSLPLQVRIGGKLTVGNSLANPSGTYFGYFTITFAQQ